MALNARPLRINLGILSVLGLIFALVLTADYFANILALVGAALIATYLLVEPVEIIQGLLMRMVPKTLLEKVFRESDPAPLFRVLSIVLVYVFFFAVLWVLATRVLPSLVLQVQAFAEDVPAYTQQLEQRLQSMHRTLGGAPHEVDPNEAGTYLAQTALGQGLAFLKATVATLPEYLLNLGATTLTGIIYALTALMLVFYFLMDGRRLKDGFVELLPLRLRADASEYLERIHRVFYGFIKGQLVLSCLAGVYLWGIYSLFGLK